MIIVLQALDDNSMLQADATVLAGLLILLTLLSFKETKPKIIFPAGTSIEEKDKKSIEEAKEKYQQALDDWARAIKNARRIRNTLSVVTLGAIIPFSLSAIFIILGTDITSWDLKGYPMVVGFVYLITGVTLLVIVYREATSEMWTPPPIRRQ
jgi:hypothetical protein